ncbi:MAG: LCP family protein [Anaerolineae bacterium]|nr:LCP family protein [Anaerolineae bacterium]
MKRNPHSFLLATVVLALILALLTAAARWLVLPLATEAVVPTATLVAPKTTVPPVSQNATPSPASSPSPAPLPTPTPSPTPTPTPTMARPKPPVLPTLIPVPEPPLSPTEALSLPLPIPTPIPLLSLPEGTMNILLLGMDTEGTNGGRTDVMIVVSVNPRIPSVSMLSIPRDYYAWIPEHGFAKINTAYGRGGDYPGGRAALVKATIEYNFGIPIHYYALVDFNGFIKIVDALGGVDVPVECELHDTFPNPENPEEGIDIDLYPGIQHLDGLHALWYVRSRWSTSDYDRSRRQQQVLRALYRQALSGGWLGRIPEVWEALRQTVETDLGLKEMLYLAWIGTRLDWANIKSRFLTPPYVTPWTDPTNGAFVLLPVPDAIEPLVAEALQPPATARLGQSPFRAEVWDGTGRPGTGEVAAERLRWEGFVVTGITRVDPVTRTQVIDFTTTSKGSPLWLLKQLYHLQSGDIIRQPQAERAVDFRVILGANYDSCVRPGAIQYVPPPPTPTPTPTPSPTPSP